MNSSRRRFIKAGAAGLLWLPVSSVDAWTGTNMRRAKRGPSLSYITSNLNATSLTTYTFSSQSIGVAASDRLVVVCVGGLKSGANPTISSVTVAGSGATRSVEYSSGTNGVSAIWSVAIAAGTTANIVVVWSTAIDRCAIGVYTITGLSSNTPTGTITSGSSTASLAVSAGGVMIAGHYNNTSTATTWTGLTGDNDFAVGTDQYSTANGTFASAQTVSVTASASGGSHSLVASSWR